MTTEAPPVPERRASLWKRFLLGLAGITAVSILILLAAGARTSYLGHSSLMDALAETDRLDPRWRWEDLDANRPLMPNVGNSIVLSRAVHQAEAKWDKDDMQSADGKDVLEEVIPNVRLDAERLAVLRKFAAKQKAAIDLAVTLKDTPRGRAPITLSPDGIGTLLPDAQHPRAVVRLLQIECERLLHDGLSEAGSSASRREIPDRVRAMLHAGAGLRDEPFLVSQLVRLACRAIAARQVERALGMGSLSDDACRRLADHFAEEREENLLLAGLRGERAGMHVLFTNLEAGRVSLADFYRVLEGRSGVAPDILIQGGAMLYRSRLYDDHASFLRWSNRACSIAAMPMHEQAAEWATYDKDLKNFVAESRRTYRNLVTVMVIPASHKVGEGTRRDNALLGCVHAALAAERFRMANGRWPKRLDELRPKFLKGVPVDPYSGKRLLLAATADGIVVYSTGPDGVDDGGKVLDVRGKPGSDFGVRLWNPDRRGIQPPPK
jgi:hypothetical protein